MEDSIFLDLLSLAVVLAMALVTVGAVLGAVAGWICVVGWAYDIHMGWGIAVLAFPPVLPALFRRHGDREDANEAKNASRLVVLAFVFLLLEFAFVEAMTSMFGVDWLGRWWLQP